MTLVGLSELQSDFKPYMLVTPLQDAVIIKSDNNVFLVLQITPFTLLRRNKDAMRHGLLPYVKSELLTTHSDKLATKWAARELKFW